MKIKTSELIGAQLDWAVEYIKGGCKHEPHANYWLEKWVEPERRYLCERASTEWIHGGPIIAREELSIEPLYTAGGLECWVAYGHNLRYDDHGNYIQGSDNMQYGPTPLIAACRCYVASKLGNEVELPEELS